jgi:hypothetical protein
MVMTFLKYGHLPVVCTHECACQCSCSQNVIHYCIETLPLRTCTYVVRVLLLVRYCPLKMRVRGGVRTLQRSASWCPLRTRRAAPQTDLVERLLQTLLVHVVYTHVYLQSPSLSLVVNIQQVRKLLYRFPSVWRAYRLRETPHVPLMGVTVRPEVYTVYVTYTYVKGMF